MTKYILPAIVASLALSFSGCGLIEREDLIRTEEVTQIGDKTLIYQMYQPETDKYRYEFKLVGPTDTQQVFVAHINDASGNEARMDIEGGRSRIKIKVDKAIENQTKTIDGFTYELEGTK